MSVATAAGPVADGPFASELMQVWRYGTMPAPDLPGCAVVVRESHDAGITLVMLQGVVTGLWVPLHVAPRSAVGSEDVEWPYDSDGGMYAPKPFDWWRMRRLVLDPQLGDAWAVVIPPGRQFA